MRRASIADRPYLVGHAMAAAEWYMPGARPTADRIGDVARDLLSGSKHFVAVGGGVIAVHVAPNPLGEKQVASVLLWVGSPLLLRAALRWVKSRPGVRGLHVPVTPDSRMARALCRMGFKPGHGGYYWWRAQ